MLEIRKTFCRVCHAACPVLVDIEDGHTVVGVRGDRDDPVFGGYTCIKGRQLADQHHDPDRLRSSLRRTDGGFEPIASADALDDIAARIRAIVDEHGPRAVASYTGTGAFQNSTAAGVAAAWHAGFDSPSFYTSVTIDQPAHRSAALRLGAWDAGWHNFTDSDVTLIVGYNPLVSSYGPAGGLQGTNPFVKLREAKERGMSVIVIDPRRTETASFADIWLQVQPGQDPALLSAMIRHILDDGLHDSTFCDEFVDGLDDLRRAVDPFTLDVAAERARVHAADVQAAAELFAAGPRGAGGTGTGPNMAPHSMLSEHLTLTLNVICGRVLRSGETLESGAFLTPGDTRRAQVIAPSDPAPGAPHRMRDLRGQPGEMLTNSLADEILEPGDGQVRALIVSGGNPVVAFPDQEKTEAALADLDLLVVIDPRMTPTAEMADYVIAPKLELERPDVPHIMDKRIPAVYTNYTPAVLETDVDLLSEWEVFAGIAARNDTPITLPGGTVPMGAGAVADSVDDDTILDLVYGTARMPIAEMRTQRGVVHDDVVRVVDADPGADARFAVAPPDVVDELSVVRDEPAADAAFPFRLVSRRMKHVLNSLGRELPGLASVGTTNPAYLHPDDLTELGVAEGDLVALESPHGRIVGVAAAGDDVKPGVVSMSHAWGLGSRSEGDVHEHGSPTNRLVANDVGYDPITGMAIQSAIPVAIRPWT
ncbi:MAG: molybdopterin-dependent oxidoreductase [Acidimicrobiales bacterium]|jgi:anaerobic selenocysteine-containing dehydrogenase|nr:molybdopterin-dependent oxidoreductase [Acidimicrobiales bacterium]